MGGIFKRQLGNLASRLGAGTRMVPILLRKPAVALLWLRSARLAQAAFIALALTVPTVMTGAIDSFLEKRYPPLIHEEILGLVKNNYDNPRLEEKKGQARTVLWACSGGLVMMLLLLHVPVAVKRAEKKAGEYEGQADGFRETDPARSTLLYRMSLNLATDAVHIESLMDKMSAAGGTFPGKASKSPKGRRFSGCEPGSDKTVVVSQADRAEDPNGNGKAPEGKTEGRYMIAGTLGQGAMGITHRARDKILERDVALKELHPRLAENADFVSRFRQEAKVLARLTHPGIVQVYDFIEEGGKVWIIMELVRGGELADLLGERGSLFVPETARLGLLMAEAMGYAHARGVVHRDFKPSNVMLTAGGIPKITDFGLAVIARAWTGVGAGEVAGSPYYMSPEQASGARADSRSDVYSMGAVLYQMLSGKVPFDGEGCDTVMNSHLRSDPVPLKRVLTDIPDELDSLILSMLAKDPDERVQDMTAVATVLKKFAVAPGRSAATMRYG